MLSNLRLQVSNEDELIGYAHLTLSPPNYSIWIFTHLKLCLADAIHNFKWVKIIHIWQNGGHLFSNIADWCHILSLTCLMCGIQCANKKLKNRIYATPAVEGLALSPLITNINGFNMLCQQLLGMIRVFKHQDLQMLGIKLNTNMSNSHWMA